MAAFRADGMVLIRAAVVLCTILAGSVVRAADEEPACRFLLQQIGFAAQKAAAVDDDVLQKAKYLERIALMERSALQGPNPSSAGVFDAELARAQESLDMAKMRQDVARSAINSATTAFVQQCPQHFAAINMAGGAVAWSLLQWQHQGQLRLPVRREFVGLTVKMEAAIKVLPMTGQDRAMAIPVPGGYLVAVADGAGGTGNGAFAAESLMDYMVKLAPGAAAADWFEVLCEFDYELSTRRTGGETTGITAFVDGTRVRGASVGDSGGWLISTSGAMVDMTAHERRRPMLGSGEAQPVEFEAEHEGGRILLGSDGLLKYAPTDRVCAIPTRGTASEAVNNLVDCVRLPSGGFHDDVAVVIVSG